MASENEALPASVKAANEKTVTQALKEVEQQEQQAADAALEDGEVNDGPTTVFDDAASFTVTHPLLKTWTLWFDNASKADKAKSWDEQLTKVMDFDTVEEFWGLYNNIVPPSYIAINSNYYLFKQGIRPAWEDIANAKGGKWAVQLPKDKSAAMIDRWWLFTMLAAIGGTFETPYSPNGVPTNGNADEPVGNAADQVTGIIVSSRKAFYRINIWTRNSDAREKVEDIGRHFKYEVLSFPPTVKGAAPDKLASDVEFTSHEASQSRNKSKGWTV